ncbi:hypothetical protein [Altererythrobacter fulvus]|uniref:hypothetical protein n=1 Tax=Caenibius fulvus TaxID=2126012 RepID=UPI003019FA3B
MNHTYRSGIARYGIARIANNANGKSLNVLLLGHDRSDAIFMPFDLREALGVAKGDELDFSISKVGLGGKMGWYVGSIDPAIHIPAWIAVIGLVLAIFGLAIGILSVICS